MESQEAAILLKEDPSRPLRFLYLYLLTNKRNTAFMQNIAARITQIKSHK